MDAKTKLTVIEPDEKFANAIRLYFKGTPYDCTITGDTEKALLAAQDTQSRPSVILMCVENPGQDIFTLSKLKSNDETRDIPVILFSSKYTEQVFQNDRRLKGKYEMFLKKPFLKRTLIEAVQGVLSGPASVHDTKDRGAERDFPESDDLVVSPESPSVEQDFALFSEQESDYDAPSGVWPSVDQDAPGTLSTPTSVESIADKKVQQNGKTFDCKEKIGHILETLASLKADIEQVDKEYNDEIKRLSGKNTELGNEAGRLRNRLRELETECRTKSQENLQLSRTIAALQSKIPDKDP